MSDPNVGWLGAGFGVAWLLIGAYLVRLWIAQRRIARRIDELRTSDRRGPEE